MNAKAQPPATRTNRRWLPRFGLKTLLILVALFGCGFGYLGHLYRRVAHQRYIVHKIREAGGEVRYDWQREIINQKPLGSAPFHLLLGNDVFSQVTEVDLTPSSYPPAPFDPHLLLALPQLEELSAVGPQVSDAWLACIASLPRLEKLWLFHGPESTATREGLSHLKATKTLDALILAGDWTSMETPGLADLKQLKVLAVDGSNMHFEIFEIAAHLTDLRELAIDHVKQIDAPSIEAISRLHQLRKLRLNGSSLSDGALGRIAALTQLETLLLTDCSISDHGTLQLQSLTNLKNLTIGPTIAKSTAEKLHQSLPHCQIDGGDVHSVFSLKPNVQQ